MNDHWVDGMAIDQKVVVDNRGATLAEIDVTNVRVLLVLLIVVLNVFLF